MNLEADALIRAATLQYFGMDHPDTAAEDPKACLSTDTAVVCEIDEEVGECYEAEEPKDKPRGDRYNYATLHLSMGILLRNFNDAVKKGDGERTICCWKFAMLIYRAYGHTKYALAALQLQASVNFSQC